MATAKFGALLTGLKGKIGGQYFRGGPSGFVLATVPPVDAIAGSAKLTKADAGRAVQPTKTITTVSGLWRLLTPAQRAAYNAGAVNWPAKNRFGETYTPSGYQVFMKINTQTFGQTGIVIGDIPLPVSIPDTNEMTFDIPDDVNFTATLVGVIPAGWQMRFSATQPVGVAIQPKNSFFKIIAQIPAGVVFPQNLEDGYKEIYGAWFNLTTVWVRIELINMTTGQKSTAQTTQINIFY